MVYYSNESLYHHGILGQKWGVRRYQNPDGSLTSAGRKRYGVEDVKKAKKEYKDAKKQNDRDYRKAYNYSQNHLISQFGKNKETADRNWTNYAKSLEDRNKKKQNYKQIKNNYKTQNSKNEDPAKKLAKQKKVLRAVSIGSVASASALKKLEANGYRNFKAGNLKVPIKTVERAMEAIGTASVITDYGLSANYSKNYWKR